MRSIPYLVPAPHPTLVSHHLVVKRGHRGRYRFVLLGDGDRISGEVWVGSRIGSPENSRAVALGKIARLAEALLGGVTVHPETNAVMDADEVLLEVDEPDRPHTLVDEGERRGKI